jgi:2,4-dienoyl-CoA reductase (NADPH2)
MANNSDFTKMFEPVAVGPFKVRNRVKYAACSISNFNDRQGYYTEREFARDEIIAATGCGIITNQGAYPDVKGEGKAYYRQLAIYDDKYIPGFKRVAEMIKSNNAVAIQQILHAGRYGGVDLGYSVQPSAIPQTLHHFQPPREMTKKHIQKVIEDHARAAERAMKAGFDGVEITCFQGYLVANFLSSWINKRTDEYGGPLENRARFMVEILKAIRQTIGSDKLLIIRLNGVDLTDEYGGSTPEECLAFMKIAEQDGGVNMISIVAGWHESRRGALGRDLPADHWLYLAKNAKSVLTIPIAFGPRCRDPFLAETSLKEGIFDFWEVCRPFLADPELLHKIQKNRTEHIKPCLGGLTCLARMFNHLPYLCTVNPKLGHEYDPAYHITPAPLPKKVFVAGGGPGGMEYALTAAQRGHQVTLFEKSDQLGGQLHMAAKEVSKANPMIDLIHYYELSLRDADIEVVMEKALTPELVRAEKPDVVVIATGCRVDTTMIPSFNQWDNYFTVDDILRDHKDPGGEVIVVGANRAGLVTAEYLAQNGRRITVLEENKKIGGDVTTTFKWRHKAWLDEFQIDAKTGVIVKEFKEGGVVIKDSESKEQFITADGVVIAFPRLPNNDLLLKLMELVDELYIIGDAVMPRHLWNAIHEGYRLGTRI